jgi:hypothetical protein
LGAILIEVDGEAVSPLALSTISFAGGLIVAIVTQMLRTSLDQRVKRLEERREVFFHLRQARRKRTAGASENSEISDFYADMALRTAKAWPESSIELTFATLADAVDKAEAATPRDVRLEKEITRTAEHAAKAIRRFDGEPLDSLLPRIFTNASLATRRRRLLKLMETSANRLPDPLPIPTWPDV